MIGHLAARAGAQIGWWRRRNLRSAAIPLSSQLLATDTGAEGHPNMTSSRLKVAVAFAELEREEWTKMMPCSDTVPGMDQSYWRRCINS